MNPWQEELQMSNTSISIEMSLKAVEVPFSTQFLKSLGLTV